MTSKTIYVVVHSNPDYVDLTAFTSKESALAHLMETAEERDLEFNEDEEQASNDEGDFVEIQEVDLLD